MEMQAGGDSQAKIKVRLAVVPENQSFTNRALAQTVANDIFEHLNQTSGYSIKLYEADAVRKMSGATEFLIWVAPSVAFIGGAFVQPFIAKLAEKTAERTAEKVADLIKKILKGGGNSESESAAAAQSFPDRGDIKATVELKNEEAELTIIIKISRDHS